MRLAIVAATAVFTIQSFALNIVLTNDDSYITPNVQQLKVALEKAGNNVLVSVPCAKQSGTGGNLGSYLQPVPVHKLKSDADGVLTIDDTNGNDGYCVGDTEADKTTKTFKEYKNGSPVMAATYGIYEANKIWGANPDLVISGPNEGRNVGFAVFLSGTLGATHQALVSGVPAIAVSAGSTPKDPAEAKTYAQLVAGKVVNILKVLKNTGKTGESILPQYLGLNVNLPDAGTLADDTPYKFTNVNWESGMAIKWSNLGEGYGGYYGYSKDMNLYGLNFFPTTPDQNDSKSEGIVSKTAITISTIDATENAPKAKSAYTEMRLNDLMK
jgi:5'-nucleotidase